MLPTEVWTWNRRAIGWWYASGIPLFAVIVTFLGALIGVNSFVTFGVILGIYLSMVAVSIYCMARETRAYNGMFPDEA